MSWLDRLQPARWRGIEFLTESHEAKGGNRLVINEFPGRDDPETEDMGSKADGNRINAYFVGPDYDLKRDEFLKVLREHGADWFMHPWLGLIWVRVQDWTLHETNDKGGYCAFVIEFAPGGLAPEVAAIDRVDDAEAKTEAFADAVVDDFDLVPMSANGLNDFIAQVHGKLENLRQVLSLATLPLTWAGQVMGLVNGIKGDLSNLAALPGQYAAALRSLQNLLGSDAGSDLTDSARPRVIARLASVAKTASQATALTGTAAVDPAVRINLQREAALRGRLVVAAAAQMALADYRSANDRDTALQSVVAALDELLPSMPDPVFQAAVAARTALLDALMAQDLAPAVSRDVVAALPAVVLAHRMGVDEETFLAQNAVRHPLFVRGRVYG